MPRGSTSGQLPAPSKRSWLLGSSMESHSAGALRVVFFVVQVKRLEAEILSERFPMKILTRS
jgi:hypothetical protein